jgi:integrase
MVRQRRPELGVVEAKRLLEVTDGERLEAFYVLALMNGLRRGELLGLRWDDVDLSSRQLHVCRSLQRVGGKLQMVEPKTGSPVRTIVLPQAGGAVPAGVQEAAEHRTSRAGDA